MKYLNKRAFKMVKKKLFYLVVCCVLLPQLAHAQGWVMQVALNYGSSTCSNLNGTVTVNYSDATATGPMNDPVTNTTSILLLKGKGSINSFLKITVSTPCLRATATSAYLPNFSETCMQVWGFSMSNDVSGCVGCQTFTVGNTLIFHPQLRLLINERSTCSETIDLRENCGFGNFGNYVWEVTDDTGGPLIKTLSTTSSSNTTISRTDLRSGFPTKYGKRYIRVRDSGMDGIASEWRAISNFIPAPRVDFTAADPLCHNGLGSMSVKITSADAAYLNDFNLLGYDPSAPAGTINIIQLSNAVGNVTYPIPNLEAKTYAVKVENIADGNCTTSVTKTINNPTQVAMTFSTSNFTGYPISCNAGLNSSNGSITVIPSGGAGGYKNYSWSTGATSQTISGLSAGTYTVSLTDSKDCPATGSKPIAAPPALSATVNATTDYKGFPVQCWDKSNGALSAGGVGGVGGYLYAWSTGATGSTLPNVGDSISYAVTVTDANLCQASASIELDAPPPINFSIDQLTNLACAGDATASLSAINVVNTLPSNSTAYAWTSGDLTSSIANKPAGTYTLTVSDGQGCSTLKSKTIVDPPAHSVAVKALSNFNGKPIRCYGDENGVLEAIVKDPTGVLTTAQNYAWTKDVTTNAGQSPSLSSIVDLGKGDYKVVVTYNTNCKAEASYFLSEPDSVAVNITPSNYNGQPITCYGMKDATLKASATGGTLLTTPYTYKWQNGVDGSLLANVGQGNYNVTVTDANGCIGKKYLKLEDPAPVKAVLDYASNYSGYGVSCKGLNDGALTAAGQGGTGNFLYKWSNTKTTDAITKLLAGNYSVIVSDENNCKDTLTTTLTEPQSLTLQLESYKDLLCFQSNDGTATVKPAGGVEAYQYSKDGGATLQALPVFNALKAGSYVLTVKDKNGCIANTSATVQEPTEIVIAFKDTQSTLCATAQGSATGVVSGGKPAYSYEWKDYQNNSVGTNITVSNVKGGVYTLFVKDANSCMANKPVPITSTDGAKATYSTTPTTCFNTLDGTASITITQGDSPFTVRWPDGQTTLQVQTMKGGTYYVAITDAKNCTVVETVEITSPPSIQVEPTNVLLPTCAGYCNGEMTLVASGGVGSYTYQWNGKTTAQQTQLCAGTYPVIVKDANACILEQEVMLTQPSPLTVEAKNIVLPTCRDKCDGALEVEARGGNGGYQYTWGIGGSETSKSNLCPQAYTISVTDSKNCKGQSDVVLENIDPLVVDLGGGVVLCAGQSYDLDAGPGWTNVNWTNDQAFSSVAQKITIKEPSRYYVEVTNPVGCIGKGLFLLETSTDLLKASFLIPQSAVKEDTVAIIDVSWPLPESIEWDYPAEMRTIKDLGDVIFGQFSKAGEYTVSLTAHLGECLGQVSKKIIILEEKQDDTGGRLGYEDFVKTFKLYPNPNDGAFDVAIELLEASPISVSVWNGTKGVLLNQSSHQGKDTYKLTFDLRPIASGSYVVRLDHAKGKVYLRFIVE